MIASFTYMICCRHAYRLGFSPPCTSLDQLDALAADVRERRGPTYARVVVGTGEAARVMPPRDGVANKNSFRAALGLETF